MNKVASMIGSMLIGNLGFQMEELPFVKKVDNKIINKMQREIFDKPQRKKSNRLEYFELAPIENTFIMFKNFKKRLDDIEE